MGTPFSISGGTVAAKGDTAAFGDKPALGAGYIHITTNPDETEIYGWTGKTEAEDTWSKTALKIQPFVGVNDELTVTATPNKVIRGGNSTLKAERTFDLGSDRTLAENVTEVSAWTITGNPIPTDTKIENYQLIVVEDETVEKLTVSAEYIEEKSYTGSADVTVAAQHNHVWATAWKTNDTHHWHECEGEGDCDITADADKNGYGEHAWDGGAVTKAPTSTAKGVKTYTCTVCQAARTEEIPIPTYTISGTVTDSKGNVVADVHIALKQGNKTAAPPTKTDADASSAAGTKKTLEYLDIQVVKTMESGSTTKTDTISTTKSLLIIVIPFDFSDKVQNSVEVYRYHDGGVDPLTTAGNGSGERIVLGEDSITLYVNKFSTYAVGYILKNDDTLFPARLQTYCFSEVP